MEDIVMAETNQPFEIVRIILKYAEFIPLRFGRGIFEVIHKIRNYKWPLSQEQKVFHLYGRLSSTS